MDASLPCSIGNASTTSRDSTMRCHWLQHLPHEYFSTRSKKACNYCMQELQRIACNNCTWNHDISWSLTSLFSTNRLYGYIRDDTDRVTWFVGLSMCHSREPRKNGWTNRAAVLVKDSGYRPRKHVLGGGAHLRHLASTIEPFMCCGNVASCQWLWPVVYIVRPTSVSLPRAFCPSEGLNEATTTGSAPSWVWNSMPINIKTGGTLAAAVANGSRLNVFRLCAIYLRSRPNAIDSISYRSSSNA